MYKYRNFIRQILNIILHHISFYILINIYSITSKSNVCRIPNSVENLLADKHLKNCVTSRNQIILYTA